MSDAGASPRQVFTLLGCGALGIPLLLYAWTGSFSRLTGDDYCYSGLFRQHGVWETLRTTYSGPSPFHGNRFSLTIGAGLVDLAGPMGWSALTMIILLLWISGMTWFLRAAATTASVAISRAEALLSAEALAFFSLALAPELEQSLYWRSGLLPYLAPLAMLPIVAALVVGGARRRRGSAPRLAAIAVLTFVAAGFSETAAAVQLSLFAVALGAAWLMRGRNRLASTLIGRLGAGLIGTSAAIVLLATAPTNGYRLAELQGAASFGQLAGLTVHHAYLFLHGLAFRQVLPIAALTAVTMWLGFGVGRRTAALERWRPGSFLLASGLLGATGLAAVLAVMLPSAYVQSSYPVSRALILAAFASALVAAGVGALIGGYLYRFDPRAPALRWALPLLFVAAIAIEPARAASSALGELPGYRRWASFWDARDREIRRARAAGDSELEVMLLDKVIPEVAELQPDPDYWYNNCAEWYYDVDLLSASLPGWDE